MVDQSRFDALVARMPVLFDQLVQCDPEPMQPKAAWKGLKAIYAFYEQDGVACHVGRTRNLHARIRGHLSKSHFSASLAFKRARQKLNLAATYRRGEGRASLLLQEHFAAAFHREREALSQMQLRLVEVNDPLEQHMFELYAALRLNTSLTEFETS